MKEINVFISHTSDERDLALAWKTLLDTISLGVIKVWLSSDTDPNGGITLGTQWRENIKEHLISADAVLAILSPRSVQRPWVLWECGMAVGASQDNRRLIPIVYSMKLSDVGDPLGAYQAYQGENETKVTEVCSRLVSLSGMVPKESLWQEPIEHYVKTVRLYKPPRAAGQTQVHMWTRRIDDTIRKGRINELSDLVEGMYSSFGTRNAIDATLHDLLSRIFLEHSHFKKALEEVDKAIELSPDDLYLHHRKALVLLELRQYKDAKSQLDYIEIEFPEAIHLPEVSGVRGRLNRELYYSSNEAKYLDEAIKAYAAGYDNYNQSYYCGVNAASLLKIAGRVDEAKLLAIHVIKTCSELKRVPNHSFWVDFSVGELYLILEEYDSALDAYKAGVESVPGPLKRERNSALLGALRHIDETNYPAKALQIREIFCD